MNKLHRKSWIDFTKIMLNIYANQERIHTIIFHLHKVQKWPKVRIMVTFGEDGG